jgi:hypothetical protein
VKSPEGGRPIDIFPRTQTAAITSDAPPGTVLERLRALVSSWPRTALAPAARQAGIYGWILEERAATFLLRPRPTRGGSPLAMFEGNVERSASGSCISGRIRIHYITRLFVIVLVVFAAGAPLGALFESVPREDWHHHVLRAWKIFALGVSILVVALLMIRLGLHLLGRHIRALLTAAARPAGDASPHT